VSFAVLTFREQIPAALRVTTDDEGDDGEDTADVAW
jgi:hypothetical protein